VEAGQIISFEKKSVGETSIIVVSNPDGVEVFIDGEKKGVTPLKILSSTGRHTIKLASANYEDNSFEVQTVSGYALTAIVDLAKLLVPSEANSAFDQSEAIEEVLAEEANNASKIEIKETPVGYLRIRAEASIESEQVGQANEGEQFEILERDEENNWYKIEFTNDEETLTGWVSGEFVTEVQEE